MPASVIVGAFANSVRWAVAPVREQGLRVRRWDRTANAIVLKWKGGKVKKDGPSLFHLFHVRVSSP